MTQPYRFRAARPDGRIVTGRLRAATGAQAAGVLLSRGLEAVELSEAPDEVRRAAVSRRELAVVFRGLASLVDAGLPLERAMHAAERLARAPLRDCLADARGHLSEGQTLARALEAQDGVVPPLVLGALAAGERAGRLALTLEQVAVQLELEADLANRIRHALAYPLLLLAAALGSLLVIGIVVVPKFAELLEESGQPLPPATRLLLQSSGFLTGHWLILILTIAAAIAAGAAWLRRPGGRRALHELLLGVPVLGPIRLGMATARLSRALASSLEAGMPLLAGLQLCGGAAGDLEVAARVSRARERVAGGEALATALEREAAMAPMALQLVALGEAGGRLADMLRRAGDLAAQETERALATAVAVLEPALVVLLGGFVTFVAAALLQAVYGLRPGAV